MLKLRRDTRPEDMSDAEIRERINRAEQTMREIASGRTPTSARSALLSRRSSTSFVQVGDQSQR